MLEYERIDISEGIDINKIMGHIFVMVVII